MTYVGRGFTPRARRAVKARPTVMKPGNLVGRLRETPALTAVTTLQPGGQCPAGKLQIEHAGEEKICARRHRCRKQAVAQRMARVEGARDEPEQIADAMMNPARSASTRLRRTPTVTSTIGRHPRSALAAMAVGRRHVRHGGQPTKASPDRTMIGYGPAAERDGVRPPACRTS